MDASPKPWSLGAGGLVLTVRVTPKAGRDAIEGIERLSDGRCVLKARVRAVPSGGAANEALRRILAASLDIAPREVLLVAGEASRIKRLLIRGDTEALLRSIKRIGETAQ